MSIEPLDDLKIALVHCSLALRKHHRNVSRLIEYCNTFMKTNGQVVMFLASCSNAELNRNKKN